MAKTSRAFQLLTAYNRQEAAELFRREIESQESAFAHWGVAYCHGADYNMYGPAYDALKQTKPWPSHDTALFHARRAVELASSSDGEWNVAFSALLRRFETQNVNTYAESLEALSSSENCDLIAIHAEGHMLKEPWKLWDRETMTQTVTGQRVDAILKRGLDLCNYSHEWLAHLRVHSCEMGPRDQFDMRCLAVLERSNTGHLRHMPTHLYIQLGEYRRSVDLNREAVDLDHEARKSKRSGLNLYSFYECHNMHFVVFACCMGGMKTTALEYARRLSRFVRDRISEESRESMAFVMCEAYLMVELMTMIRFGMWHELHDLADAHVGDLPTYVLFMYYAKGIANAALGRIDTAQAYQRQFILALEDFPREHRLHNETVFNIASVAKRVLAAEILYRVPGSSKRWTAELSAAIVAESRLAYDEPPPYMIPVRQTMGALLSESGRHLESISHFSIDLDTWPRNAWSLAGMNNALTRAGTTIRAQYDDARRLAQTPVKAACACATTQWSTEGSCGLSVDRGTLAVAIVAVAAAITMRNV